MLHALEVAKNEVKAEYRWLKYIRAWEYYVC